MHYSVKDKLKAKVRASKALVFLRADFAHLGHGRQVSRALTELQQERVLVRAGYGVYTRPMAEVAVDHLVAAVKARLGRRVNRLVTFGHTTVQLGVRAMGHQNAQSQLDSFKLELAQAVLRAVDTDPRTFSPMVPEVPPECKKPTPEDWLSARTATGKFWLLDLGSNQGPTD